MSTQDTFKVILIGDTCVGKTSIVLRFTEGSFVEGGDATIGVDFKIAYIDYLGKQVKFCIWDTAGQERYRGMTAAYYNGADGVIVVYDITNEASFRGVEDWLGRLYKICSEKIPVLLIGNKSDLADQRVVSLEDAYKLASSRDMSFIETSAKRGDNVGEAFKSLTTKMIERKFPKKSESFKFKAQPYREPRPESQFWKHC